MQIYSYNPTNYRKPVDQITFFSKLLNMVNVLKHYAHTNYRELFYRVKMITFLKKENNYQGRKLKTIA